MIPVKFPEANYVWAKNQPQYLPLPAYSDDQRTITCWSLSWTERLIVLLTGRLWLSQLNFGGPLQPLKPSARSPFVPFVDSQGHVMPLGITRKPPA